MPKTLMSRLEVRFNEPSVSGMLNKTQRLLLGLFVLLLVDVIWVSSSELTKYLYKNAEFEKPFFNTYIKTSMFTIYLLGLCFWPPWRDQCNKPANYMFIDPELEDESFYTEANTSLSDPTYVPTKYPERSDRSSGTESDDCSSRSVRFSKLAEVRHMSETDATEALLARLSYSASMRVGEMYRRAANKLDIEQVCKLASVFCILWFSASYTYQAALAHSEAGMVTVLSSSSAVFTLLLSALFPSNTGDKFTLSKLVAVCLSISGLVIVSVSDTSVEPHHMPSGVVLSLISAFFYAAYLVFLKRQVDHEDKMDIPLFFGFVGLFNMMLLWPLFFILHYSHWERFEWPTKHQWMFLLLNGLVGTVVSEVLWLWGCLLTSSLIATVALSLTVPLTMVADIMFERVHYPSLFFVGSVPVFLAFLAVTLLAHFDNCDPVLDFCRRLYHSLFRRTRNLRLAECEIEQTESLIGINDGDHEA